MDKKITDKIEAAYVLNGTEHEDISSPLSPFQGKTLAKYMKVNGEWSMVMRDASGQPNLGYLAKEINSTEASKWRNRIEQAAKAGNSGYIDSEGHWFAGEAVASVITLQAWNKLQVFKMHSYYSKGAVREIDRLADEVLANNHPRSNEYSARYGEAVSYLNSAYPDSGSYPYLSHLSYKGLSLKEAAELVVEKFQKAEANDPIIAELRMKKNLLVGPIPLYEKKEIYDSIVAGLKAAKV